MVLLLLVACCFSFAARASSVDDFIAMKMRERHIPGVALAVVRNGKILKRRGYGLASIEHEARVTPATVFEIGSISKQMTAAAILLLVEDGKVNLDKPVSLYLPDTPPAWNDITVRHLLTHTSGLKNYTALTGFELTEKLNRKTFIERLSLQPLDFSTGSRFAYSNSGYNLLGYIIEAVSGKPYWTFMRERIFAPLGMSATQDRNPALVIPHRANGYEWNKQENRCEGRDYDLTDIFSAGAITATLDDMLKWNAMFDSEKLLKQASIAEMWKPFELTNHELSNYGLGWFIEDKEGHTARVRHNGQTAGFAANITRYKDNRLSIIVLTNLGDQGLGGELAEGVAKLYLTKNQK